MRTISVGTSGYGGLGSFHSDNVEGLINRDDLPLDRPICVKNMYESLTKKPSFGKEFRSFFYVDFDKWTYLNHGAFGAVVSPALQAARLWEDYIEKQSLRALDREAFSYICTSIRAAASLINVPPQNLVLVPSATYALSAIIASFPLTPGRCIYMLDIGYGSVKTMVREAAKKKGVEVVFGEIRFPLESREDFLEQFQASLPSNCGLAVLDHITSNTGLILPIKEMIATCRKMGVFTAVDGAHGLLHQEIDFQDLGCDYYVSNCHKWLCSRKGLAIMCVSDRVLASGMNAAASSSTPSSADTSDGIVSYLPRNQIISHGYGVGFQSEFMWDGTRDYSTPLALYDLIQWWNWVDMQAARTYCRKLLRDATSLLQQKWNSNLHVPLELGFYSNMACVEIPLNCYPPGSLRAEKGPDNKYVHPTIPNTDIPTYQSQLSGPNGGFAYQCKSQYSKMVQDALYYGFQIEVPTKTLPLFIQNEPTSECTAEGNNSTKVESRCYLRISAMVYNCIEDYERLANALLSVRWHQDGASGECNGVFDISE